MKNVKYIFDSETLSYVARAHSVKTLLLLLLRKGSISLLLGIAIFLALYGFIQKPIEIDLQQKQTALLYEYRKAEARIAAVNNNLNELQLNDNNMYRRILELPEIPIEVRNAGFGGVNKYKAYENYPHSATMISALRKTDILLKKLYVQSKSFDEIPTAIAERAKYFACLPAIQPVMAKKITGFCKFGMRTHPILGIYRLHAGVDLCAPLNTEIYASGDGRITKVAYHYSLGHYIHVSHGFGLVSVYGHLNKVLVKTGQKVKRGELIALMGTTGISTVSHLHYEIHKNGEPQDPIIYYNDNISGDEYKRILELSGNTTFGKYD